MNRYELERDCPQCGENVRFEQFTDKPVTCRHCGAKLSAVHECYDEDPENFYCLDFLELNHD